MFPEYRDLITRLRQEDSHFAALFDKHNDLDHEIVRLESNPVAAISSADEIERLKKEKLHLKDQIYSMLKAH